MKNIKKTLTTMSIALLSTVLVACGGSDKANSNSNSNSGAATSSESEKISVTMITDQGGVNDKSFNQSAKEGLDKAKEDGLVDYRYLESHKEADYAQNLETALDDESDMIFTIGYALYNDTKAAAEENPDQLYAIVDNANLDNIKNLTGITFADNENSFLAGYVAGMTTKSNTIGFVGGIKSEVIDRFEYGFKAGIKYAARERGEDIEVLTQYAESYADAGKGKSIANQMYQKGADIIFHAAGGTGEGVIEAAKENDKYVIGVDRDQQEEAPDNMLLSTIKGVGSAMEQVCKELSEKGDSFESGRTIPFGLKDGDALSIKYADNDLVSQDVKDKTDNIKKEIIDGALEVPQNEEEFKSMGYED